MRNHEEAYSLATYLRDMLYNEPDTKDTKAFIEHSSDTERKLVRVTLIIPYEE